MLLATFILSAFLITKSFSQTCTNSGSSFRDTRFNDTLYSYCYHLPTLFCSSNVDTGNYVQAVNETCDLLDVTQAQVPHTILTAPDYRGSERCGCLTPFGGTLVVLVDANPVVVNDAEWKYRVVNTIDWFYHFILRRSGPAITIYYIFAHGSTYYETSNPEIYDDFANVTLNPYISNSTVSDAVTYPCAALNRALTILNGVHGSNERRWLFYWGFSTPSLTGCTPYSIGFTHIATYAIRQTLSVDLSSIESTYGDFTECNWYVDTETSPTESEAIQDRAIVGTLSDFLCARSIGEAVPASAAPTPIPTTTTTTPAPVPSPSVPSPTYQPTWVYPSSEPTARQWWSSRHWWSSSHSSHKHHHHHHH
jgi:hypothetical protein